jgi:hypothetical protein
VAQYRKWVCVGFVRIKEHRHVGIHCLSYVSRDFVSNDAFDTCRRTLSVNADRFESGAEVMKEAVCAVYITVSTTQLSLNSAQPHWN